MLFEIKQPITGAIMQVAEKDFPSTMNWDDAMSACQNLGHGWRLPSIEELEGMSEQLHTKGKGNFKTDCIDWYWSSSEGEAGNSAWYFSFEIGRAIHLLGSLKYHTNHVRAVRTLP